MNIPAGYGRSESRVGPLAALRHRLVAVGVVVGGLVLLAAAHGDLEASPLVEQPAPMIAMLALGEQAAGPPGVESAPLPASMPTPEARPTEVAPPPPPPPPLPPDYVARMVSARLGINHYIEEVGVTAGQMDAPTDGMYAVGWYSEWATPGRGGNAVFSAHETWNYTRGPFYSLRNAVVGDAIEVRMTSGAAYTYIVVSNQRYQADTMPVGGIIWPEVPAGEEWITLITCGGRFVPTGGGLGDYLDRDVVVAKRQA